MNNNLVIVRGAGDIATGIIYYLFKSHFNVLALENEKPSCIRREVAFSTAIYENEKTIDGVKCVLAKNVHDINNIFKNNNVALIVDSDGKMINKLKPQIVIDAIIAKKNLGTNINMAELVIGVGPGFTANVDCHFAIESMRGHKLGTIYKSGSPIANTGIPAKINNFGEERVMHSPVDGVFMNVHTISDIVKKNEVISRIEEYIDNKKTGRIIELKATIDGVLRGILPDGFFAYKGLKCADIDPRIEEKENCFLISDKARCIAGACLVCINEKFYL